MMRNYGRVIAILGAVFFLNQTAQADGLADFITDSSKTLIHHGKVFYESNGHWKMKDLAGEYSWTSYLLATKKTTEEGVKYLTLSSHLAILKADGEVKETDSDSVYIITGNGFYDIYAGLEPGGEKIGSGYCMDSVCHSVIHEADGVIEETIMTKGWDLYSVGSHKGDFGHVVWTGKGHGRHSN